MNRILITLLLASCFAESGLAMDVYKEPNEDPQEELNEQLVWAIQWRNSDKIIGLLDAGADVNGFVKNPYFRHVDVNSLIVAADNGHVEHCQLLLAAGADVAARSSAGETALSLRAQKEVHLGAWYFSEDVCRLLIRNATFNPHYTKQKLHESQSRMLAALWALKHAQPKLPKDVCNLIFQADPELWQDFCSAPIGLHAGRYERIPCMPFPVIRALIKGDKLALAKTMNDLTSQSCKNLRPLMVHAYAFAQTDEMKAILNPDTLAENHGPAIRENIRKQLQEPETLDELFGRLKQKRDDEFAAITMAKIQRGKELEEQYERLKQERDDERAAMLMARNQREEDLFAQQHPRNKHDDQ